MAMALGAFCNNIGISTTDLLLNNDNLPQLNQPSDLVNGLIYELGEFRKKQGIAWKSVSQWIAKLCESFLPFVTFNEASLKISIERLLRKVSSIKRNKGDWQAFLEQPYNLPVKRSDSKANVSHSHSSDKCCDCMGLAVDLSNAK